MEIKFFKTASGKSPVEDYIFKKLEPRDQLRVKRGFDRVNKATDGLSNLFKSKYAENIASRLSYIRPGALRIFFVIKDEICWFLHIFYKKSNRIPLKELNIARSRRDIILK